MSDLQTLTSGMRSGTVAPRLRPACTVSHERVLATGSLEAGRCADRLPWHLLPGLLVDENSLANVRNDATRSQAKRSVGWSDVTGCVGSAWPVHPLRALVPAKV